MSAPEKSGASLSACECLDGGHDTGNGVCMCGGTIMDRSSATEPRCVPLCGAIRAYGQRALDPAWWWKHEALCPMREHLRKIHREALS